MICTNTEANIWKNPSANYAEYLFIYLEVFNTKS